jgi:2-polyprenyl-3-methyl-5-hydroxy-6-metoxy-1,4-benzoquinol methylase
LAAHRDHRDSRYEASADAFDWFKRWEQIKPHVQPFLPRKRLRILVLGCGNSTLSGDMADEGHDVVSIDYSPVCIAQMQSKRPELECASCSVFGRCLERL